MESANSAKIIAMAIVASSLILGSAHYFRDTEYSACMKPLRAAFQAENEVPNFAVLARLAEVCKGKGN